MKILIVSNPWNINSGFSIVAKNVGLGLQKVGYDVTAVGMQQSYRPEEYYGIKSLPLLGLDMDEVSQLIMNVKDTDPDIIWNLFQTDSGQFSGHLMAFDTINKLNEAIGIKKKIKGYIYTPVESLGLAPVAIRDLKMFIGAGGIVVSQCKWGQEEMMKEGIKSEMVYHGVDTNIFKPIDSKEINRLIGIKENNSNETNQIASNDCRILRWIRDMGEDVESKNGRWDEYLLNTVDRLLDIQKGRFVFLVVAQNIGVRKRLERAMKAYSIFIEKNRQLKDRTLLHIHTQPFNPEGIPVMKIAQKLGIEKNTIFSYGRWKGGWTATEMSILYNSCDCHLSASSGEGFGISTIESMACGLLTVGPRNTSYIELVEKEIVGDGDGKKNKKIGPRGILVGGEYQMIPDGTYRFLINEQELADTMERIYKDEEIRESYGENCLEFAKLLTWDRIISEWDRLFKNDKNDDR